MTPADRWFWFVLSACDRRAIDRSIGSPRRSSASLTVTSCAPRGEEDRLLGFGPWAEDRRGLTFASNDDVITTYGTGDSEQRFRQRLDEWFSLGMPDLSCFRLRCYPADAAPPDQPGGWTTRHSESVFHWALDT